MPLTIPDAPKWLKPLVFHGVDLDLPDGSEQARGDCPFCDGARKFYAGVATGEWDCKSCQLRGNVYQFLAALHEKSMSAGGDYEGLARDRGLLDIQTLIDWGVARSYLTGEWLLPAHNQDGKLNNLYRYCKTPDGMRLYGCPSLQIGMFGMGLYDPSKPVVAFLEGPWDGMAFYEVARRARPGAESTFVLTANQGLTVYGKTNILAVPGAGAFLDVWAKVAAGKKVWFGYDNDHPQPHKVSGVMQPPAAFDGTRRACLVLAAAEEKPETVQYLCWGPDGWTPNYPHGFDVRDYLKAGETIADRVRGLGGILANLVPIPEEWVPGRSKESAAVGGVDLEPLPCTSYRALRQEAIKAMKWSPGLDKGLRFGLAVIVSTTGQGSQLWGRMIAPPSTGKTSLCEAFSVAKKYVKPMSHFTGFYSGIKDKEKPGEDLGLVAKLFNKTLVTKDGDTLLQSDSLGKILGEARDIYDRTARTHFKTDTGRDYGGVNMTWILCGTASLRKLDTSELGERFITCSIMDRIDLVYERDVQLRVARRAYKNRGLESNGKPETQHDPAMVRFMRMCGGYVNYLRENASGLQEAVTMSDETLVEICDLARFVAFLRARPSVTQNEVTQREFSPRLTEQFVRLAICLAAVMNLREVSTEVMTTVRECALDTARGLTLDICAAISAAGPEGLDPKALSYMFSAEKPHALNDLLRYMRKIEVVETFSRRFVAGVATKPKYRLKGELARLWPICVPGGTVVTSTADEERATEADAIASEETVR